LDNPHAKRSDPDSTNEAAFEPSCGNMHCEIPPGCVTPIHTKKISAQLGS
jgi:hypothetical protein